MSHTFLTKNTIPCNITMEKAEGCLLWDKNNKEYLDFSSQTLNLNLGNSPYIAKKAFNEQFDKFCFLSTRFESPILMELAQKLISIAPSALTKINLKLTNGGDANESAFKRVRALRKKPLIVSFYSSHLGESSETLAANGKHFNLKNFSGSRNFIHIVPPFILQRQGYSVKDSEDIVLEQLEFMFKNREDIAGIILEPIMVNAGGYSFTHYFLKKLRLLCTQYNISLIFDEIQTAFGWLGTFFASTYFDVTPDLMTLGKGLGCGFPLAAVLMKSEYDVITYGEDEYTYGGHPISCAIALENIKHLESTSIMYEIHHKSSFLKKSLENIQRQYDDLIVNVRVYGLIGSIEFISKNSFAQLVYEKALEQGLILRKSADGEGASLVLKPPLIVTTDQIQQAKEKLSTSIKLALDTI